MLKISVRNSRRSFSFTGVVLKTPISQLLIGGLQQSVLGELPITPVALSVKRDKSVNTLPSMRGSCVLIFPRRSGLPGHSKPSVLPCDTGPSQLLSRVV